MKINVIKCLLSVAMAAGISATTHAEDVAGSHQVITAQPVISAQSSPIFTGVKVNEEIQLGSSARAPAPPLTLVSVLGVYSSSCGWEYPPSGAFSTSCNHGGSIMRVAVLELGYGSNRVAWMNGSVLPSSAMYNRQPVCSNVYGELDLDCSPGQTVVGFVNYYNLDGEVDGQFRFQDTSTNSPFNTMSVEINIL
ncbi:YolA family protein [Saccharospirillum sp. HFRX-1]|uniref:YolA family protein n=1 Tax=unclassified Saccharospirillum TaxID=2633430 RepID=UPI003710FE1C